jgi:hypothetical protein
MTDYAFPTLLAVLLVEIIVAARWYPWYFTHGLLVYRTSVPLSLSVDTSLTEDTLQQRFSGVLGPSLLFRELAPGEFGFRHPTIELKLLTYTPVMHGFLRLSTQAQAVEVEGRANWLTIAFSAFLILFVSEVPDAWALLVFAALLLGLLYLFQVRVYSRVASFVAEGEQPPSPQPGARSASRWVIIAILVLLWIGGAWYWFTN